MSILLQKRDPDEGRGGTTSSMSFKVEVEFAGIS